jgi:hypothetical protein
MMVAVAVAALPVESLRCLILARSHRAQAQALDSEAYAIGLQFHGCTVGLEHLVRERITKLRGRNYHEALATKYERAAARPWFPVAPDPPAPQ